MIKRLTKSLTGNAKWKGLMTPEEKGLNVKGAADLEIRLRCCDR
jgi:hypothetical protein